MAIRPEAGWRLRSAMEALYRAEINCGLQSFFDGGWRVWIGDESNSITVDATGFGEGTGSLDGVARWLLTEANRLYPDAFKLKCSKCQMVLAEDYHYLICSECFRDGMENEVS